MQVLREFDFDVSYEQVRPLVGMGGDKLVQSLTGLDVEVGRGKDLAARRADVFLRDYLPSLSAFPGAHELIQLLHADGLRLVIATSAKEDELEALLEQAGLSALIKEKTSSDDAEESKPDPDIIQAALKRGKLDPTQSLMLGDTPYDIQAAARAGVGTVALRCGGWWSDQALAGAVAIYDDPRALATGYADSPFGAAAVSAKSARN